MRAGTMREGINERIAERITGLVTPVAEMLGLEIVSVVYRREAEGFVLRIFIDRPEGVTLNDCTSLSRELSAILDVEDPIPSAYRLEVSSPGLDRPLVKPGDFDRFAGREITLKTDVPQAGERRNFRGLLVGTREQFVLIEVDGVRYEIEYAQIARANLVPEIGESPKPRSGT